MDVNVFKERMTEIWEGKAANVATESLRTAWGQLADCLNGQIEADGQDLVWQVFPGPTGMGKTLGLALYASMLPREAHPGALIVTRFTEAADRLVDMINDFAGDDVACARHSKKRGPSVEEMADIPVLVISHRAFEMALEGADPEDPFGQRSWNNYINYSGEGRSLIIVDEAPDLVRHSVVTLDGIRQLSAVVRERFWSEHEDLRDFVQWLDRRLASLANEPDEGEGAARVVHWDEDCSCPNLEPLEKHLKELSHSIAMTGVEGTFLSRAQEVLKALPFMIDDWAWYTRSGDWDLLQRSHLILPEGLQGGVILDATGRHNRFYDLLPDRFQRVPMVKGIRTYRNVTLRYSECHNVGKTTLRDQTVDQLEAVVQAAARETGPAAKLLVICHVEVEPKLATLEPNVAQYEVAHWGNLDGKNDWADFTAVLILGLPYRNPGWAPNVYMACCGPQGNAWVRDAAKRTPGKEAGVCTELVVGQLAVDMIQAANRVACRKVTDQAGNCSPVQLFVLLPEKARSERLLKAICEEMPGISLKPWDGALKRKGVRKSDYEQRVLRYLEHVEPNRYPVRTIQEYLNIPKRTMERIQSKARKAGSSLRQKLAEIGVYYEVMGRGRGASSCFVKVPT